MIEDNIVDNTFKENIGKFLDNPNAVEIVDLIIRYTNEKLEDLKREIREEIREEISRNEHDRMIPEWMR